MDARNPRRRRPADQERLDNGIYENRQRGRLALRAADSARLVALEALEALEALAGQGSGVTAKQRRNGVTAKKE
jgi:hypothetical protein